MRERGVGILIAFAAKYDVTVKAEAVVKTSRLGLRFFYESLTERLDLPHLSTVDLEIACDAHAFVLTCHTSPPYDFYQRSIILPFTPDPPILTPAPVTPPPTPSHPPPPPSP